MQSHPQETTPTINVLPAEPRAGASGRRWAFAALALILLVAAILRLWNLGGIPPGMQHDEVFDAGLAQRIVAGERPVFFPENGGLPPLFMYLTALPFGLFGASLTNLRLTAALSGLAGIVLAYLLLQLLFGRLVALLTSAALALSFWHIFDSRLGLEPITLPLFATASFYTFWLGLRRGHWAYWVLTGILLGLSVYTYHSGFLVPLTLAVFALYLLVARWLWQRGNAATDYEASIDPSPPETAAWFYTTSWRNSLIALMAMFLIALLIVLPLALYVLNNPDASTARVQDLMAHLYALRNGDPGPILGDIGGVVGMFGWRGDPWWRYNIAGRPVFNPLMAALFWTGIVISLWRFRRPEYAFLLVWIPVNLVTAAITPPSPSSLRSLGAIPAIYVMPVISLVAVAEWTARRRGVAWKTVLVAGFVGLLLIDGIFAARDYFVIWPANQEVRDIYRADLAQVASFLREKEDDVPTLLSAEFAADLDMRSFGFLLPDGNFIRWFDGRRSLILPATEPAKPVRYIFPATAPLAPEFQQAFFPEGAQVEMPSSDLSGQPAFIVYEVPRATLDRRWQQQAFVPQSINLGDEIQILGVKLPPAVEAGEVVSPTVAWQVRRSGRGDLRYAFFSHLVDDAGFLWETGEVSAYPSHSWGRGDIVIQTVPLRIPPDLPPGEYKVQTGVFEQGTGDRLPVMQGNQASSQTTFDLPALFVSPPATPTHPNALDIAERQVVELSDLTLLGHEVTNRTLTPGQNTAISLWWMSPTGSLAEVPEGFGLFLLDEQGSRFPQLSRAILDGRYRSDPLPRGTIVRDRFFLDPDPDLPRGLYQIILEVDNQEIALGELFWRSRPRQYEVPEIEFPRRANLDNKIEFLGYDLDDSDEKNREGSVAVTLYWRTLSEMDTSYTVFTHLLDDQEQLRGQWDGIPDRGESPTTGWLPGEIISDPYQIPIQADAPPGPYRIEIGLYDAASPNYPRLPLLGANGQVQGDRILLGEVRIN
ncbi:MAG: glycosyltransferase family 39 protein [Chloroflexota bacterium]|nr:glycosyltransferase family 39 protein [Chloroflexota bacterium]